MAALVCVSADGLGQQILILAMARPCVDVLLFILVYRHSVYRTAVPAQPRLGLPDSLVRFGIKKLLKKRLQDESANDPEQKEKRYQRLLENLRQSAIAIVTGAANAQHYEVPAAFYQYALGKHLKYSSCYWDELTENLDQAEARMLAVTAVCAELANGQHIFELGCGWGSLTLWMVEHFPASRITAVSNSSSQHKMIKTYDFL